MDQRCGRCKQTKSSDLFQPSYRGRDGTYCRDCTKKYVSGVRVSLVHESRECLQCLKSFVPERLDPRNTCCSTECRWKYKDKIISAKRRLARLNRSCLQCGEPIEEKKQKGTVFCSKLCSNRAHNFKKNLRIRAEAIDPVGYVRMKLGNRDNWICGICGDLVSPLIAYPDPLFASVDHIVPISKGGTGDEDNLRMVHLLCNLKKGDRIEALGKTDNQ